MKDCLAKDYWTTKKDHWTTEILFDERLIGRPTKILISKDWRERLLGDMTIGERLVGERRLGERLYWAINWDYWAKFGKTIGRKIIWTTKKNFVRKWKDHIQKTTGRQNVFTKDNWEKGVHAKDYLATKEDMGLAVGILLLSFIQAELNVMSYHVLSSRVYAEIRVLAFWEPLSWISDLRLHLTVWPRKHSFLSPNSLSPEGPSPNCF